MTKLKVGIALLGMAGRDPAGLAVRAHFKPQFDANGAPDFEATIRQRDELAAAGVTLIEVPVMLFCSRADQLPAFYEKLAKLKEPCEAWICGSLLRCRCRLLAQIPIEKPDHHLEGLLRLWQVDVIEEGVPHAVPDVQFRFDADLDQFPMRIDGTAHLTIAGGSENQGWRKLGERVS